MSNKVIFPALVDATNVINNAANVIGPRVMSVFEESNGTKVLKVNGEYTIAFINRMSECNLTTEALTNYLKMLVGPMYAQGARCWMVRSDYSVRVEMEVMIPQPGKDYYMSVGASVYVSDMSGPFIKSNPNYKNIVRRTDYSFEQINAAYKQAAELRKQADAIVSSCGQFA